MRVCGDIQGETKRKWPGKKKEILSHCEGVRRGGRAVHVSKFRFGDN